jgi:hypothetical protein
MSDQAGKSPLDVSLNEVAESEIRKRSPEGRILKLAQAAAAPALLTSKAATIRRLIEDSLGYKALSSAEILNAAYGDRDGLDYWAAWLSRKSSAYDFARLLATHQIDEAKVSISGGDLATAILLKLTIRRMLECLTLTLDPKIWLTPAGTPPSFTEVSQNGFNLQRFRRVEVNPREATVWFLGDPAARNFVPKALEQFIRKQFAEASAQQALRPNTEGALPDTERVVTTAAEKPAEQRRRRSSCKLDAAVDWLTKTLPHGTPAGRSIKELANLMREHGLNVSETTVNSAIRRVRTSTQNNAR